MKNIMNARLASGRTIRVSLGTRGAMLEVVAAVYSRGRAEPYKQNGPIASLVTAMEGDEGAYALRTAMESVTYLSGKRCDAVVSVAMGGHVLPRRRAR